MDKSTHYKHLAREMYARDREQAKEGKDRAEAQGITFTPFKARVSACLTYPSTIPTSAWYGYWNDYCSAVGGCREEYFFTPEEFAEVDFKDWREDRDNCELKSKTNLGW